MRNSVQCGSDGVSDTLTQNKPVPCVLLAVVRPLEAPQEVRVQSETTEAPVSILQAPQFEATCVCYQGFRRLLQYK